MTRKHGDLIDPGDEYSHDPYYHCAKCAGSHTTTYTGCDGLRGGYTRAPTHPCRAGHVLVPIEPTPGMMVAGFLVHEGEHDPAGVYRAMLAAAWSEGASMRDIDTSPTALRALAEAIQEDHPRAPKSIADCNRALKLLRTYHQYTQVGLAKRLGISNSYLSELEKGDKTPGLDLLERYSEVFKMPVSSILFFSESINEDRKPGTKLRVAAADKILRLLEWLQERDAVERTA